MENLFTKEIPKFKSPEEELQFLRAHIAEREKALIESGHNKPEVAAHEVVKEYAILPKEQVLPKTQIIPEEESANIVLRLRPESHDTKMEELLGILLTNGIKNALEIVMKIGNPHLDDDFHRFLIQYIQSATVPSLKEGTPLFKALHMKLFEITLPEKLEDDKRPIKEFISMMEQFYAGMQSVGSDPENYAKNYYTLEIALSGDSDHVVFYASVPSISATLFEKQVLGLYGGAKIREVTDDYNIFSDGGVASGAYAELAESEVLPIKTYESIDHDPIQTMLSVFSKMKTKGEGAAIQIIITPTGDKFIKKFTSILQKVKEGMDFKKASELFGEFDRQFAGAVKHLIFGTHDKKKEEEKKIDEIAVAHITEKMKSTIMSSHIRVLAGAETKSRAEEIVVELESAFNQFAEAGSNKFIFKKIEDKKIKEFTHNFSYRTIDEGKEIPLNLKELATVFHFPLGVGSTPQLKTARAGEGPAPLEMGKDGILLGYNDFRGVRTEIRMAREDRVRHLYVVGQTGTGKTSILKNLIAQDIANGDGCCFIDPHGSDIQDILSYIPPERIDDVIYFDPAYTARPMGLNMLEYDPNYPEQKTFVVNEMMNIFNQLFDLKISGGAMFEQYFKNSAFLVMEHPESGSTLLEVTRVLADKEFRDMKLSHCRNPIIRQFWETAEKTTGDQGLANFVPYISSKFDPLISNDIMRPVIAQQHSSLNFRKIMDEKKILLVNLSKGRLGDINANLIGLILVGKIQMAALSRVDMFGQKMNDFYLYIDEFQNVTTPSIASILSEARKYRLSLNVAHQYIAQLTDEIKNAVFGNVGSMAVFRVSPEDAKVLEPKFSPTFTSSDIIKLENYNAYVSMIINGAPASKPFNMVTAKNPEGNREIIDKLKELSYLKYGRDREEVEAEIFGKYEQK
ncbi:MAG: TraM recognition domain-containing protein [Candidatus Paceibacterota bacterium]|jgi:hypothetical protein